ncbi:MAG TPA: hypothetical protein VF622_04695 [Segetibacter sp.]
MAEEIIHIKDCKIENPKAFDKLLYQLKDGKHLFSAKRINKRSNNQNRYYWGICVAMIRDRMIELGNDVDSQLVHDYLKDKFNRKELWNGDVNIGSIGDTTTKLSKLDFEEYLEKVKRFAADVLEIYIPNPNEPMIMFATYDSEHSAIIVT